MNETLWIWDIGKLKLCSLMVHQSAVRNAEWDPTKPRVAFCTGNDMLYMWSPAGASCVQIPAENFCVQNLRWNPNGDSLVLIDKDKFCVCFIQLDVDYEEQ